MKKVMRVLVVLFVICFFLFLNFYVRTHNMGVFNPKGVIAVAEKNLMVTALSLMMIVIIPVFVMLFSFAWRYREGNAKAKYLPDWHTSTALELVWWAVPTVIIGILATITWTSTHDLDPYKKIDSSIPPITIEVVALDWKWLFIYPRERIATVNYVAFPKDVPVFFKITADAPMNAFWIPQLSGQVYAMPGMTAQLNIMGNEVGDYKGLSSNFSGDGFSGMKFTAHVGTQEEYDNWVRTVQASENRLDIDTYTTLAMPSKDQPVQYYSSVEDGLYDTVLMKFMPDMQKKTTNEMSDMDGMHSH